VRAGINLAAVFAIIAQPIIPDASKKVLDALGIPEGNRRWPDWNDTSLLDAIPRGAPITPPDVLFQKIEDTQVAEWTERFGGGKE
jgi:methionyl-tRNA synthetase